MSEVSSANTRRLSQIENMDLEILNRVLVGNDVEAHNEWRQLDPDWRKHIWKLYDDLVLGDVSVNNLVYY